MKAKDLLNKVKANIYFKEFDRLTSLSSLEYEAESRKKEFPKRIILQRNLKGESWYDVNKYDCILLGLKKQMLKYNDVTHFDCGIYTDIQAEIYLQYSSYRNDKRAEIKISFYEPFTGERYNCDAPINLDLNNPKKQLNQLFKNFVYTEGQIAVIQLQRNCDKNTAKNWFKVLLEKKYYYTCNPICENKIFKWIEKNFNIQSFADLEETVKTVNLYGKQNVKTKISKIDTSFMYCFDGDVDELENEIYKANPINQNIIYIS